MHPKVLVLDEPTAGLDPKGREEILDQVALLQRERKITVVLVSHSMEDVAAFADKVLVMNKAKVFAYDTVENVFARSEELKAIRLAVPQITNVFRQLSREGYPVPENVYTVAYAKRKLLATLAERGKLPHA